MSRDAKKRAATWLLSLAAILVVGGIMLWQKADDDASKDRTATSFKNAIRGSDEELPDAELTPAIVSFVLAGCAGLAGLLMVVTLPEPKSEEADAPKDDGPETAR